MRNHCYCCHYAVFRLPTAGESSCGNTKRHFMTAKVSAGRRRNVSNAVLPDGCTHATPTSLYMPLPIRTERLSRMQSTVLRQQA